MAAAPTPTEDSAAVSNKIVGERAFLAAGPTKADATEAADKRMSAVFIVLSV